MAGTKGIVSSQFYKFSAANQTITFSNDYAGLDLGEIAYITNIKNGVATVIYDPFDSTKGGTLNGLTLTLAYNTTTMQDTDPLQVIVGFTPLNADPLPVTIVEGADQKDDTELLNRIADGIDYLSLSLDQAEGVEINTRDRSIKKDSQGAIVPSDNIEIQGPVLRIANDSFVVDTTGYNSVVFVVPAPAVSTGIAVIIEASHNGATWQSVHFTYNLNNGSAPIFNVGGTSFTVNIAAGNEYHFTVAATSRYLRLRTTAGSAGFIKPIALLKSVPFYPPNLNSTGNTNVSITQYAGTAVSTAQQTDAAGNLSSAGNFAIGSSYVGTTNRPNAASSLATGVPYPISIGGREQPYIGALAGVFRHITVDGGGRYILGGDAPDTETRSQSKLASGAIPGIPPRGVGGIPNNIIGAQSMTVNVTNQDFGDTQVSLLRQILTELKILNQNFAEMPQMLNNPSYELSEPQEYRDNGAFDSSTQ